MHEVDRHRHYRREGVPLDPEHRPAVMDRHLREDAREPSIIPECNRVSRVNLHR
jgi:hypothetical protein